MLERPAGLTALFYQTGLCTMHYCRGDHVEWGLHLMSDAPLEHVKKVEGDHISNLFFLKSMSLPMR